MVEHGERLQLLASVFLLYILGERRHLPKLTILDSGYRKRCVEENLVLILPQARLWTQACWEKMEEAQPIAFFFTFLFLLDCYFLNFAHREQHCAFKCNPWMLPYPKKTPLGTTG